MRTAAVAVIGGGVVGASVAYHLASRGWRDIVILDRGAGPGEGSTGRATGGYRAQFPTAINVQLSLLARAKLQGFQAETGVDPGYLPAGYLWLAATEAERAELRGALRVQQQAGLREAAEVGPAEVARLNPALAQEGILAGFFCPTDGFIRPLALLEGYLAAAARLGVGVEWNSEVVGFSHGAGGAISQVFTTRDTIAVAAAVNTAGAWAGALAERAGVALPVVPLRRQVAATVPCDLLPAEMPMTIFAGDGFHFRVRDGRVLLLWPKAGEPDRPYDDTVDPAWVEAVAAMARARVPALQRVALDPSACWAGLYEMSPDKHAILGAAPGCANLFLANGSSGHGVMHAPALGQLLAEIMSDGAAASLDASALRPTRFDEGKPNPVSGLL